MSMSTSSSPKSKFLLSPVQPTSLTTGTCSLVQVSSPRFYCAIFSIILWSKALKQRKMQLRYHGTTSCRLPLTKPGGSQLPLPSKPLQTQTSVDLHVVSSQRSCGGKFPPCSLRHASSAQSAQSAITCCFQLNLVIWSPYKQLLAWAARQCF